MAYKKLMCVLLMSLEMNEGPDRMLGLLPLDGLWGNVGL